MAMADGNTGPRGDSSEGTRGLMYKKATFRQVLAEEKRIHAGVFQESTNLGKRSDIPLQNENKGMKPHKRLVVNKRYAEKSLFANSQSVLESASIRKPASLAEVSTQISVQTSFDARRLGFSNQGKTIRASKLDFKKEIFQHLLITDVCLGSTSALPRTALIT